MAHKLAEATKDYSLEAVKSAIAQSTLNKEQIKAVLTQQGLQGEILETTADELANVASTNAVTLAQKGATTSTLGLSNAFKGLWAVMKAHPIISIAAGLTAVVGAVVGINKAIEKHNKELRESSTELTNAYKNSQKCVKNY